MSRRVRQMTALGLGGFLLGTMLLTSGTASAGQLSGGGRQVIFGGGGVLGLTCESSPSVPAIKVPADGTVRVVNRTGRGATLRIDGRQHGAIPENGSTEVVFRRGTTAIALEPGCAITDEITPVLVTATPTVPVRPDPTPAPTDQDPGAQPTEPTWTPLPDTKSPRPDSAGPGSLPSTRAAIKPHITRGKPARARATNRQAAPRIKTPKSTSPGTAGASVPSSVPVPSGDAATVLPGVPTIDLSSTMTRAAPVFPAPPPADIVAAEPVRAMRPLPNSQPLGLLTLIASVCVAGVAAGLIRAFVSQRASRT